MTIEAGRNSVRQRLWRRSISSPEDWGVETSRRLQQTSRHAAATRNKDALLASRISRSFPPEATWRNQGLGLSPRPPGVPHRSDSPRPSPRIVLEEQRNLQCSASRLSVREEPQPFSFTRFTEQSRLRRQFHLVSGWRALHLRSAGERS